MNALFLIGLIYINLMRKYLGINESRPDLDSMLTYFRTGSFVLLVLEYVVPKSFQWIILLAWLAFFGFVLYVLLLYRSHRFAYSLLMAVVPFLVVFFVLEFIVLLLPSLKEKYETLYAILEAGAYLWLIAFSISISSQRKSMKKEEEERKRIEEQRNSLEVLVSERTQELEMQKNELEEALKSLKATQNQLIQSEKLASLGELTAGIAHEIQNPLNFVNNFSEINQELLEELRTEITNNNKEEIDLLLNDLKANEEKVAFHGKRADAIVKSMLQHSRRTEGGKEETDINALADEYLRLSYHGLRAKDKSFNASFELEADAGLPKIEAIPQDLGRVILNLINNAFYAVNDRKKTAGETYRPAVKVITRNLDQAIEIEVKDNGTGIPEEAKGKIFQPFFTTKPTGEGTGLGLSLSYDIIRNGHNGDLSLKSVEGEGTSFIVQLPKNKL